MATECMEEIIEEKKSLLNQIEMMEIQMEELSSTNNHLVSATLRERDLKKELTESKKIIEAQHEQIASSINYSKRIQQSMIANNEQFLEHFNDSFIYYQPKDVISGDFPWFFQKENFIYFAVVDCTGHGVPGAMLATIGTLLLNDIVNSPEILGTNHILNQLHTSIVSALKQEVNKEASNDGMDIGLCRYNTETQELMFSGAHRNLFVYSEGKMKKYKSDKFPIGGCQYHNRKSYSEHTIQLKKEDVFFLFSDGIPDQFGGGEDDKFGNHKIKEIIANEVDKGSTLNEIKEHLRFEVQNWMDIENCTQTDDMLIIGIQV